MAAKFKISLSQKILAGFLVPILLFGINGIVSIFTIQKNKSIISEISKTIDPSFEAINDFNLMITKSKMLTTNWVYLQNNAADKQALQAIHATEYPQLKAKTEKLASSWQDAAIFHSMDSIFRDFEILLSEEKKIMETLAQFEDYEDPMKKFTAEDIIENLILPKSALLSARLNKIVLYMKQQKQLNELELDDASKTLLFNTISLGLTIMVLGLTFAFYMSNSITGPVKSIKEILLKISKGELPEFTFKISNDEIGEMQMALKQLVNGFKSIEIFTTRIGKGELDSEYQLLSNNDKLGKALLDMRSSLKEAEIRDKERNKIIQVSAEIGNILRNNPNLDLMGDYLLKYLCIELDAVQGAFYIVEKDIVDEKPWIILKNSYAYTRKKNLKGKFRLGEGLVGQSAIEMDLVYRTEIPDDYVTITSGLLGDKKPCSIIIIPLITNEKIYGLLEFASIRVFSQAQIAMLKETSEIIAQTVFNLQINDHTSKLLAESQRMSSELKEQSIVLQQNAEEMKATQEELQKSNIKLEEQISEVEKSQKRTYVLLENSSEVITICDKEGKIQYISPSVKSILGYEPEELIGTSDTERINQLGVEDHKNIFIYLLQHPMEKKTVQYSYIRKGGDEIWLEVTGKNMLSDPAIKGIVLNIRDITERRNAEKESRMRSQMQSLSENSPDLICRLNKDGKFYYINPTIELLTDKKPDQFLQKTIFETDLNESVVKSWEEVIENVLTTRQKIQVEMPFPTKNGSLVMNVNAIPEYTDDQIESILVVSNDITERKKAELEIQTKNKKITESINYAQRIQVAILPEQQRIKQLVPEYFMLYKPRDVVSGDFPWFVETDDAVFIAAVDCTGHGVPGAMLSLIGYFLLNDIVKSQRITEPGKILDLLDEGVTRTLKQDIEGSEMKDGMDISLCKISKNNKKLEYAGAHRPLYQLRKGEIIEYKGNKFPIGGGLFKNQTVFTNYEVVIEKGDSFFFCSDGYPDQFGGPESKKIGPARIKNIIIENDKIKDFGKMETIFNEFFLDWKGSGKQMDDVLLIGIKF